MTHIVRIDPDGTIEALVGTDLLALGRAYFGDTTSVLLCSSPYLPSEPFAVGVIHDWGRTEGHPLNLKAWAMYGRSPICGSMLLAFDSDDSPDGRQPLPDGLVDMLGRPIRDWLRGEILVTMREMIAAEPDLEWVEP